MVKSMGVGDTVFFGPEAEFFVFDDVRYSADPYNTGFKLDSIELPTNSDTDYEGGNLGHRIGTKKGYFPVPPQDIGAGHALARCSPPWRKMGVQGREAPPRGGVGPARARHEVRADDATWPTRCRSTNTASTRSRNIYGKTATFMPKPIYGDNGSGMHCHQSIWKGGKPVFAGNKYADLSETCLSLHRRHHQARQGDQRLHQPDHQLLQAAGAGLRGAGAARLFGAQPLGLVPHPLHDQPEGQARRGPLPRSARQSVSRLRRDADGRPRRHQEQARSGRRRWTRTSTTCRRRS